MKQVVSKLETLGVSGPISMGTLTLGEPLSGVLKTMPRFHGHLKASLQPLSGVIKVMLPIETPVIHVPLSGRAGETLPEGAFR